MLTYYVDTDPFHFNNQGLYTSTFIGGAYLNFLLHDVLVLNL